MMSINNNAGRRPAVFQSATGMGCRMGNGDDGMEDFITKEEVARRLKGKVPPEAIPELRIILDGTLADCEYIW